MLFDFTLSFLLLPICFVLLLVQMNIEKKNRCCVATCKGERFDLAHKFPKSVDSTRAWLDAIDNPDLFTISLNKLSENYQVCSRHFRIEDYKNPESRSLNKTAVPNLNLKSLNQLHLSRDSSPRQIEHDNADLFEKTPLEISSLITSDPTHCQINYEYITASPEKNQESEHDDTTDECHVEELECIDMAPIEQFEDMLPEWTQEKVEEENSSKVNGYSSFFEVGHPNYEKPMFLNAFWLRCHCHCVECYEPKTHRRKINLMDVPRQIQARSMKQVEDGLLLIEWEDGHQSTQDIEFLFNSQVAKEKHKYLKIAWSLHLKKPIEFSKLVVCEAEIQRTFQYLYQYGAVVFTQIPFLNLSMAKLVISRLFPQLETVNFEKFSEEHSDICTNLTYTNADCGLKCFFAGEKSELILVDGLNVAQILRKTNISAFEVLTRIPVPLEIETDHVSFRETNPVIQTDPETGNIARIQLDTNRIGLLNTLPQDEVGTFYDGLRELITNINAVENQLLLTLHPGTMVILDNWRVLHKITTSNNMSQCYLSRKDFICRLRNLELIKNA